MLHNYVMYVALLGVLQLPNCATTSHWNVVQLPNCAATSQWNVVQLTIGM